MFIPQSKKHEEDSGDDGCGFLADDVRTAVLNEAKRRGYDTDRLIWVKQEEHVDH